MATFLIEILTHTPLYVWAILALLVWFGLKQSKDHTVGRTRVIVQPVALGLFSLWGVTSAFGFNPLVLAAWLLGGLAGLALNLAIKMPRRIQGLANGTFAIGGSWMPMVLLMTVFFMRYIVNVSLAVVPQLAHIATFAEVASLLYGLPTGLLAARALRILTSASRAPSLQTA